MSKKRFFASVLVALGIAATAGVAVASADDGMTHNQQCRGVTCMTHNTVLAGDPGMTHNSDDPGMTHN